MNAVVLLALIALPLLTFLCSRALMRVGPSYLRPAHAPLWLFAGLAVALAGAVATLAVGRPAELLARALGVAAVGPGARVTHLALALAALLVAGFIMRLIFVVLRRRRLDRPPVPDGFRLFGIGPDGAPLRAFRGRLFAGFVVLTIVSAGAGAWAPPLHDTVLWASLVALFVGATLAFAPVPRAQAPARAAATVAPTPAEPDGFDAVLAALGRPPLAERRPAVDAPATFAPRVIAAAAEGDLIVEAPIGAGKTGAALEVARRAALDGRDVVWIAASSDEAERALVRFHAPPEALILPPLLAVVAGASFPPLAAIDLIVIDDIDLSSGLELAWLRALVAAHPDARALVAGTGPGVEAAAKLVLPRPAPLITVDSTEKLATREALRWLVPRLPEPCPSAPEAVIATLTPRDAHRHLGSRALYAAPTRELFALEPAELRRRAFAPPTPRPLVPATPVSGAVQPIGSVARATPVRTTRVRVVGTPNRTRHRFRGPAELELWDARVELTRHADGERHHDHDQRRAHTSLVAVAASAFVVDARLIVLPTADPVVLHTLAHVVRDLLPWFFRAADTALGVTTATPAELPDPAQGRAALVLHDAAPDAPALVSSIAPRELEALLTAAKSLLESCDCASHCARCCESTRCTATPHNVELDRHRAVAVLESLFVPRAPALARRVA